MTTTFNKPGPAIGRFLAMPARCMAVRYMAALGFAGMLFVFSGSGPAMGSKHVPGVDFIRLDDFKKTYSPGKFPDKWKSRYLLPYFGRGERSIIHFVHKGPGQHYIRLASGKDNWFSLGLKAPFRAEDWPVLEWEWKIGKFPKGGDVRKDGKDDQAGAICFILGYGTFGFDTALCYLYENSGPKNKLIIHRNKKNSRFFFPRTREADGGNRWYKERRNLLKDYIQAFGKPPKEKGLLVIFIDSNSTETSAEAFYRNIYQRKK